MGQVFEIQYVIGDSFGAHVTDAMRARFAELLKAKIASEWPSATVHVRIGKGVEERCDVIAPHLEHEALDIRERCYDLAEDVFNEREFFDAA